MLSRYNTLDGLRGFAALSVMIYHFTQQNTTALFNYGNLAVDFFFCLSGFVIAHAYQSKLQHKMSLGDFVLKRLIRLGPMFILGILLGVIGLWCESNNGLRYEIDTLSFILTILNTIPSWSLFFEMIVNIVFAACIIKNQFKHAAFTILIISGIWLFFYILHTHEYAPGSSMKYAIGGFPRSFYQFFAGFFIYLHIEKIKNYLPQIHPILLIIFLELVLIRSGFFIILVLLCVLYLTATKLFNKNLFAKINIQQKIPSYLISSNAIAALTMFATLLILFRYMLYDLQVISVLIIFVPILVALGAVSTTENALINKQLDYLGWLSYPIYCVHKPVLSIYTAISNQPKMGIYSVIFCILVTVVLSHLLAKYIDEPLRKIKRSY